MLGQASLLPRLFGRVLIPLAVAKELQKVPIGQTTLDEASRAGWLEVRTVVNLRMVEELSRELDGGESEAIALASEMGISLLLIDEADGRAAALLRGLEVVGVGGVLVRAKAQGLLPLVRPSLDWLMTHTSYRLHRDVYAQVLRLADEFEN